MQRLALISMLSIILFACKGKNETNEAVVSEKTTNAEGDTNKNNTADKVEEFDITTLPISEKNIGDFPFFSAPEGAMYINNVKPKDFDFIVFVTPNDIFEVEGKTFRAWVHEDKSSNKEISGRYLERSYEDAILNAGGVKVFEGILEGDRKDKYVKLATYAGDDGSIDIYNNPIITYAIHRNDGNIYIALEKKPQGNTSVQIVQEKAFEQTIKPISSDKIRKDLEETGKSVLHINFDTDKATLKPDGITAVNEIVKVLKNIPDMKIEVNGHTDNTGSKEKNQKLSEERAATVKNEIINAGVDGKRLKSKGYGQASPIADNNSAEGRAQNRRVELIKF